MGLFKNIIEDGYEYNKMLAKFNEKKELVDVETIEVNKVITISLEEYKELLVYKGKYLGITNETTIASLYADGTKVEEMIEDE